MKRRLKEPGFRELRFRKPSAGKFLRTLSEEAEQGDREAARTYTAEHENAVLNALLAA